jgi:formylglycine-generating enzyme required for sulfatase activity
MIRSGGFLCIAVIFVLSMQTAGLAAPAPAAPYTHLDVTGEFKPGGAIEAFIAGDPGAAPVGLFLGFSLLEPPLDHAWGLFHLDAPWFLVGPLGSIPGSGIMLLPTSLDATPGPYDVYIQALVGDELTNLFAMEVRNAVPSGMALIPGGEFDMGDHHAVGEADELPVHAVYVDSFLMDVREVSCRQYCDFLNAAYAQGWIEVSSGRVKLVGDNWPLCNTYYYSWNSRIHWDEIAETFSVTPGKEDHPIGDVSWFGAVVFANWRSAEAGLTPCYDLETWECDFGADGYRLPTEAEWEYAARGGEHDPYYIFPWGSDVIDGSKANYSDSGDPWDDDYPETTPVGYYNGSQSPAGSDMANAYGLYDMAGNMWEWCHDWYQPDYYTYSPYDNPTGPVGGVYMCARGGSWYDWDNIKLRCSNRYYHTNHHCGPSFGCRLVRRP